VREQQDAWFSVNILNIFWIRKVESGLPVSDANSCSHQENNYRNTLGDNSYRTTRGGCSAAASLEWRSEGTLTTDETLPCRFEKRIMRKKCRGDYLLSSIGDKRRRWRFESLKSDALLFSLIEVTHSKEETDRLGVNSNRVRTTNATRLRIQVRSKF
jgi:hypothetical protein